jgi:N-acyl-phosphatidylethanolamine-hydrolysing phospholipase D
VEGVVRVAAAVLLALAVVLADLAPLSAVSPRREAPAHHLAHGFRNLSQEYAYTVRVRAMRLLQQTFVHRAARGQALQVLPNDGAELRANGTVPTVTWIGHSTFLIQIAGVNILTDPHWSERASPVSFAGPRRLVPPGMRFEDLPPIHAVVISHDHYDHLDEPTVRRIAREHQARFFVPLGHRAWLADAGVEDVVELDWWQSAQFRGLTFVCTPAQHSSGRTLTDQNERLWSSWAVIGAQRRLFFAGDTGYWPGLAAIGDRLGPFDLAAIPIGGYYAWTRGHPNHVNPEEAVQLLEDVRGRLMVPMHWGTFDMNREPFREPPDRLFAEALRRGIEERIAPLNPGQTIHW